MVLQEQVRDLAVRLAGAAQSRRLYAAGNPIWLTTLEALKGDIHKYFSSQPEARELTVGLLGEGLAVCGVPLSQLPPTVSKLLSMMKARDVEIVSVAKETTIAEIETLLAFLSADAAEIAGADGTSWLRERGVEHIQIRHLHLAAQKTGLSSFGDIFRSGPVVLSREFELAVKKGQVDIGPISELADSMRGLLESGTPVASFLAMKDRDDYLHVHAMNVGLLALTQAQALGLEESDAQEIATAGMLHDIGKIRIPDTLLNKRTKLSSAEQAMMNTHASEGARLLIASHGGEKLAAIVAAEHHVPQRQQPLLASQLVALADTFDTLRTLKPFQNREGARGAIHFMLQHRQSHFHPYLLGRFATLCGYWQPGDFARLKSGEVGKVVQPHAESIEHPTLEIIDRALGDIPAGAVVDLADPLIPGLEIEFPLSSQFQGVTLEMVDNMG